MYLTSFRLVYQQDPKDCPKKMTMTCKHIIFTFCFRENMKTMAAFFSHWLACMNSAHLGFFNNGDTRYLRYLTQLLNDWTTFQQNLEPPHRFYVRSCGNLRVASCVLNQHKLKTGIFGVNVPREELSHFQVTDKTLTRLSDSKINKKLIQNYRKEIF